VNVACAPRGPCPVADDRNPGRQRDSLGTVGQGAAFCSFMTSDLMLLRTQQAAVSMDEAVRRTASPWARFTVDWDQ
jgi:hypothetical protein